MPRELQVISSLIKTKKADPTKNKLLIGLFINHLQHLSCQQNILGCGLDESPTRE